MLATRCSNPVFFSYTFRVSPVSYLRLLARVAAGSFACLRFSSGTATDPQYSAVHQLDHNLSTCGSRNQGEHFPCRHNGPVAGAIYSRALHCRYHAIPHTRGGAMMAHHQYTIETESSLFGESNSETHPGIVCSCLCTNTKATDRFPRPINSTGIGNQTNNLSSLFPGIALP